MSLLLKKKKKNTYTTYCNLSPLSNLMIQNPRSKNDRVIFLRAKKRIKNDKFKYIIPISWCTI